MKDAKFVNDEKLSILVYEEPAQRTAEALSSEFGWDALRANSDAETCDETNG